MGDTSVQLCTSTEQYGPKVLCKPPASMVGGRPSVVGSGQFDGCDGARENGLYGLTRHGALRVPAVMRTMRP